MRRGSTFASSNFQALERQRFCGSSWCWSRDKYRAEAGAEPGIYAATAELGGAVPK